MRYVAMSTRLSAMRFAQAHRHNVQHQEQDGQSRAGAVVVLPHTHAWVFVRVSADGAVSIDGRHTSSQCAGHQRPPISRASSAKLMYGSPSKVLCGRRCSSAS